MRQCELVHVHTWPWVLLTLIACDGLQAVVSAFFLQHQQQVKVNV